MTHIYIEPIYHDQRNYLIEFPDVVQNWKPYMTAANLEKQRDRWYVWSLKGTPLSNFYPIPLFDKINKMVYPSAEHMFQAFKTDDLDERRRIAFTPSAAEAKKLGRKVKLRPTWEDEKVDVMYQILKQKFNIYNHHMVNYLIDVGNRQIVETNWWHDEYWGVCCKKQRGRNILGRLLKKVQDEVEAELAYTDYTEENCTW